MCVCVFYSVIDYHIDWCVHMFSKIDLCLFSCVLSFFSATYTTVRYFGSRRLIAVGFQTGHLLLLISDAGKDLTCTRIHNYVNSMHPNPHTRSNI